MNSSFFAYMFIKNAQQNFSMFVCETWCTYFVLPFKFYKSIILNHVNLQFHMVYYAFMKSWLLIENPQRNPIFYYNSFNMNAYFLYFIIMPVKYSSYPNAWTHFIIPTKWAWSNSKGWQMDTFLRYAKLWYKWKELYINYNVYLCIISHS